MWIPQKDGGNWHQKARSPFPVNCLSPRRPGHISSGSFMSHRISISIGNIPTTVCEHWPYPSALFTPQMGLMSIDHWTLRGILRRLLFSKQVLKVLKLSMCPVGQYLYCICVRMVAGYTLCCSSVYKTLSLPAIVWSLC